MIEMIKFNCCLKSEKTTRKNQILSGGKSMIQEKLDIIHILKKNLEFDRFKNLMLRDYQLILLAGINSSVQIFPYVSKSTTESLHSSIFIL